jgi:hypothetical protein
VARKIGWMLALIAAGGAGAALDRLLASPHDRAPAAAAPIVDEATQAERERQHYDRLDALARAGSDTAAATRVRQNLAAASADVLALDCSAALCRVEMRAGAPDPRVFMATAAALGKDQGTVSMRPLSGASPVYYVAAPGQRLPAFAP